MRVDKERVKLLVDALRSGEYKQGRNYLRCGNESYCCLGVACDVALINGLDGEWMSRDVGGVQIWTFNGTQNFLPLNVTNWYGFDRSDPDLKTFVNINGKEVPGNGNATAYNDVHHLSFDEIADAFERTYLKDDDAN